MSNLDTTDVPKPSTDYVAGLLSNTLYRKAVAKRVNAFSRPPFTPRNALNKPTMQPLHGIEHRSELRKLSETNSEHERSPRIRAEQTRQALHGHRKQQVGYAKLVNKDRVESYMEGITVFLNENQCLQMIMSDDGTTDKTMSEDLLNQPRRTESSVNRFKYLHPTLESTTEPDPQNLSWTTRYGTIPLPQTYRQDVKPSVPTNKQPEQRLITPNKTSPTKLSTAKQHGLKPGANLVTNRQPRTTQAWIGGLTATTTAYGATAYAVLPTIETTIQNLNLGTVFTNDKTYKDKQEHIKTALDEHEITTSTPEPTAKAIKTTRQELQNIQGSDLPQSIREAANDAATTLTEQPTNTALQRHYVLQDAQQTLATTVEQQRSHLQHQITKDDLAEDLTLLTPTVLLGTAAITYGSQYIQSLYEDITETYQALTG